MEGGLDMLDDIPRTASRLTLALLKKRLIECGDAMEDVDSRRSEVSAVIR
jgi:hypothetical protein